MSILRCSLCVVLLLGLGAMASAEPAGPPYAGVTSQGGEPPSPKTPPPGMQYVTWPGFNVSEGGSEVFLQLTGPVTYKEQSKGHRLLVTMDNARVYLKNNLRPVITSSFRGTPVSRFRLRPLKKGQLRLEISLRRKSAHTLTVRTVGQYHYLIVTFPR